MIAVSCYEEKYRPQFHFTAKKTGCGGQLIAAFTYAKNPYGQAIAFSNDHGRSWEYYDGGKYVVPNQGR